METKEFKHCVLIKEIKSSNAMNINGVDQTFETSITIVCCPSCGRVLYNLGDAPIVEVHKWCNANYEGLTKDMAYCPSCGQKLDYPSVLDVDIDVKIVDEEGNIENETKTISKD